MFISKICRNFAHVIELERHIEILLLSNDCVIVPHLGGFMAHHVEAHYDEHDNMFLPPLRTLGFNPQLNINDSLLVQSYIEAYDISYPEALQRIEDEVEELKQHLENEGTYELNDIGVLALNDDGNYIFTPCEAGILTPSLYGLSSVEIKRLSTPVAKTVSFTPTTQSEEETAQTVEMVDNQEEEIDVEEDTDVIRIKYTWIRNAVAVAAILLAVFILALPTGKTEMMTRTISNINNGLLFGMMNKDTNASKIDIDIPRSEKCGVRSENTFKADSLSKADTAANVSVDSTNLTPHPTLQTPRKQFCIVLASYVSMRNANAFVEQLKQEGYEQSEVFVRNNVTRVIYGHYASEQDAYNDLRRIHRHKGLSEAWVMKI